MRYTIFGIKQDALVESKALTFKDAMRAARFNSDHNFKARIWDGQTRQFVRWTMYKS